MSKKSKKQRSKKRKGQPSQGHAVTERATAPTPPASGVVARAALVPPAISESDGFLEQVAHDEAERAARDAGEERAEEHRAAARASLAVEIHLASASHFFAGLSGDISEGGVFVSTYRPLAVGEAVDLEFSLPGSHAPISVRGEVRWLREHGPHAPRGVGIAFEDLGDKDRARIHDFCSVRPPLYYDDVG